jgi:hypothetical protein
MEVGEGSSTSSVQNYKSMGSPMWDWDSPSFCRLTTSKIGTKRY